jgi:hypothetical protein
MPLLTKVGSFAKRITPGVQVITGVGFTPKAIIFWTAGSLAASGTWNGQVAALLGFTAGPANSYCCFAGASDGVATTNTTRRIAAKAISMTYQETLFDEADLQSFDADGFTLNWTAASNGAWGAVVINYMVLGGSDITDAKVMNWTSPTTATNKVVTGVGFKPDLVLHSSICSAGLPTSVNQGYFSFGMMNKHGQQCANSIYTQDGISPSNTSRMQQTDACISGVDTSEANSVEANFVSMDTDGFTVNFSRQQFGASAPQIISLCLKGISSKIGAFNTAAAGTQKVSRVDFPAKSVLMSSMATGPQAGPVSNAVWMLGASDLTSERSAGLYDKDNVTPSQVDSIWQNNASALLIANTGSAPVVNGTGSITAVDSDSFDVTLSGTSSGYEVLYLALGDAGVDTFPNKIGDSSTNDVTATAYSNQRKLDRCQNGNLVSVHQQLGTIQAYFWLSSDDGKTWPALAAPAIAGWSNGSIFIDLDDYIHVVWKQSGTGGGRVGGYLYYMRGTPNAGRTSWTWSAALAVNTDINANYPDIVAFRLGTGWKAFIVDSWCNTAPSNFAEYIEVTITSGGGISASAVGNVNAVSYGLNVHTWPSIDFNHTGDGKTVAGGTPHLYVAWSAGTTGAGKGIRFRKAVYAAGVWTWNTEREIDNTHYSTTDGCIFVCMFDGTRVVIAGAAKTATTYDFVVHDRDAADTTSTLRTLIIGETSGDARVPFYGNFSYDSSGNLHFVGGTYNNNQLIYRKFDRGSNTLLAVSTIESGILPATGPQVTFKRGYSNNRIEWVYTTGNNSPYAVKYDRIIASLGRYVPQVML